MAKLCSFVVALIALIALIAFANAESTLVIGNLTPLSTAAIVQIILDPETFSIPTEKYDFEFVFDGLELSGDTSLNLVTTEVDMQSGAYFQNMSNITMPFVSKDKLVLSGSPFPARTHPAWYFNLAFIAWAKVKVSSDFPSVSVRIKTESGHQENLQAALVLHSTVGEALSVTLNHHVDSKTKQNYDTFSWVLKTPNQQMGEKVTFLSLMDSTPFDAGDVRRIDPSKPFGCTINDEPVDARISPFDERPVSLVLDQKTVIGLLKRFPQEWRFSCTNVGIYRPRLSRKDNLIFLVGVTDDQEEGFNLDAWVALQN